jgi:Leucine-rich repeat (LRR) protein
VQQEIEEITKLVRESKGLLNLKGQRIAHIPSVIQRVNFDQIIMLDIRGNEITVIEEAVCKNLTQVKTLDARGNRIREISPHIKAMMMLQELKLD